MLLTRPAKRQLRFLFPVGAPQPAKIPLIVSPRQRASRRLLFPLKKNVTFFLFPICPSNAIFQQKFYGETSLFGMISDTYLRPHGLLCRKSRFLCQIGTAIADQWRLTSIVHSSKSCVYGPFPPFNTFGRPVALSPARKKTTSQLFGGKSKC